jgi:hypothetical protein
MSGSMKCKAALIVVLSIGGLPALLGQQSSGTGTTLPKYAATKKSLAKGTAVPTLI